MAVSDSSVLIALSSSGQLDLVPRRFPDGIAFPRAVWREVVQTGAGKPGADQVSAAKWLQVLDVPSDRLLNLLLAELDQGEAEAIALSISRAVNLVLLDETDARQVARRMGLSVLGTIGLLLWGRRVNLFPALRPQLNALVQQGKFRISQEVYQAALKSGGE